MKSVICVENVSKRYRVARNQTRARYRTLRDVIVDAVKAPFQRAAKSVESAESEEFWALKDVSFALQPGEVVGIIGRNGAGKSTLLKILSRITKPTHGRIELNGRVGSLLEVGTGFHPELTGRENIFLNGSILGMSRSEIQRKFDDIVAFAEIETFLDTPTKRYSSGMYVRLAFAVAAHLEPEILIVDEVLAVGDAGFQKRCLGKIEDIAKAGRTILLVSHQMGAVQTYCSRCILLDRGGIKLIGERTKVIAEYLNANVPTANAGQIVRLDARGPKSDSLARFVAIRYGSGDAAAADQLYPDGPAEFVLQVEAFQPIGQVYMQITVQDRYDTRLVDCDSRQLLEPLALRPGLNELVLRIDSLHLNPGSYQLSLGLAYVEDFLDYIPAALELRVSDYVSGSAARRNGAGIVSSSFSCRHMDRDQESLS